jgi:hypothetical protein
VNSTDKKSSTSRKCLRLPRPWKRPPRNGVNGWRGGSRRQMALNTETV